VLRAHSCRNDASTLYTWKMSCAIISCAVGAHRVGSPG
jgi:hypothetical protein